MNLNCLIVFNNGYQEFEYYRINSETYSVLVYNLQTESNRHPSTLCIRVGFENYEQGLINADHLAYVSQNE